MHAAISVSFSYLLHDFGESFGHASPADLSSTSVAKDAIVFFTHVLQVGASKPSFFEQTAGNLSVVGSRTIVVLLLSAFSAGQTAWSLTNSIEVSSRIPVYAASPSFVVTVQSPDLVTSLES